MYIAWFALLYFRILKILKASSIIVAVFSHKQ